MAKSDLSAEARALLLSIPESEKTPSTSALLATLESDGASPLLIDQLSQLVERPSSSHTSGLCCAILADCFRQRGTIPDLRAALNLLSRAADLVRPTKSQDLWVALQLARGDCYSQLFRSKDYPDRSGAADLLERAAQAYEIGLAGIDLEIEQDLFAAVVDLKNWARDGSAKFRRALGRG